MNLKIMYKIIFLSLGIMAILLLYFYLNLNTNAHNNIIYGKSKNHNNNYFHEIPIRQNITILSANIEWELAINNWDNTLYLKKLLSEAKNYKPDLVVFTQGFPQLEPVSNAETILNRISAILKEAGHYTSITLNINNQNKIYPTTFLFDRKGNLIGSYQKTHKMSDENIEVSNSFPVFKCDFGNIAFQIGTDILFWEVSSIYKKLSVDYMVFSTTPFPVEDKARMDIILKGRAVDQHMTIVTSGYKSQNAEMTNFMKYGSSGRVASLT